MQTMQPFDLKSYMSARAREVDQALEQYLPEAGEYLGNIGEAMRYCVFPGGKRFRPFMALAAAEAVGADRQVAMPVACAFEMIHCFSLAHDDLPCMDDDDERRGKPTCHKIFGEEGALLAGDGLSIWAFHTAAQLPEGVAPEVGIEVMKELALASGHPGMVGGQVIDLIGQRNQNIDGPMLQLIHAAKTGALIRGAARCGALVGGADPDQLHRLTEYGERVGLVFQITDDILDAEDDPEPVSFPAFFGLEESRRMATVATEEALEFLSPFGASAEPLRALATFLLERKS